MKLYLKIKTRWQAETPARAKATKAVLTWIVGAAVAVSVGYDTMPPSLQSFIPQTLTSSIAMLALVGRVIAGLQIMKGGKTDEKT